MQANTIHVNPKFKSAHINPNFLQKQQISMIHINPKFLNQEIQPISIIDKISPVKADIITKTRRKLVRISSPAVTERISVKTETTPMVKFGSKKLIRASYLNQIKTKQLVVPVADQKLIKNRYKIIRTNKENAVIRPINRFVGKYSLCRVGGVNNNITPVKVIVTDRLRFSKFHQKQINFGTKKIEMLNINGVLYKSTGHKLQKTLSPRLKTDERTLFVRGEKFLLDPTGKKLTRASTNSRIRMSRIDIGGLTYKATTNSTYIRTESHKTRTHLSFVKQKSINLLSSKLRKSNVPCAIYRKLGKCSTFIRGRCPKVHDPKQISICQKFLKGECTNDKCLLSHAVNFSKMPVCKFYLQGCCSKTDCPYLHKKLNDKVSICEDFLKGYCLLANKCNQRHELVCPNFDAKGKCEIARCPYPHKIFSTGITTQKKYVIKVKPKENSVLTEIPQPKNRYYVEDKVEETVRKIEDEESEEEQLQYKRKKLGVLPSYIPID